MQLIESFNQYRENSAANALAASQGNTKAAEDEDGNEDEEVE